LNITDDIRKFRPTSDISPELRKLSQEYYALAVLKYCDKQRFGGLRKAESPDLQDSEGYLGIEVTDSTSAQEQQISGESIKFRNAKTDTERENALRIICRNGGDRNAQHTSYPIGTKEGVLKNVQNAYCNKLKKLSKYRRKCSKIGLVIRIDFPISILGNTQWGTLLTGKKEDDFDYIILLHWSGIDIYDVRIDAYSHFRINREDMDDLKRLGRMTAEGIINDNDPIWQ